MSEDSLAFQPNCRTILCSLIYLNDQLNQFNEWLYHIIIYLKSQFNCRFKLMFLYTHSLGPQHP